MEHLRISTQMLELAKKLEAGVDVKEIAKELRELARRQGFIENMVERHVRDEE